MKKKTMPVEPDEMPIEPGRQEIKQPKDPKEPEIPKEDNENIPEELPPGETKRTEVPPTK
jgi:hypothetical protein